MEVVVQVVQTELQLLVHQTEVYMVVVEVIQALHLQIEVTVVVALSALFGLDQPVHFHQLALAILN